MLNLHRDSSPITTVTLNKRKETETNRHSFHQGPMLHILEIYKLKMINYTSIQHMYSLECTESIIKVAHLKRLLKTVHMHTDSSLT